MGQAVVVFFKIAAEPTVVIANPADGTFKVVVGIFEAFDEDVAGDGETRQAKREKGQKGLFIGIYFIVATKIEKNT